MLASTLEKIRLDKRISHTKQDEDIQADIDACLADLRAYGIIYADETDPLIFNAIKLWCRALNPDDAAEAAEWQRRYDALKASLGMTEGYGWKEAADE